jgi:hypothetical protein
MLRRLDFLKDRLTTAHYNLNATTSSADDVGLEYNPWTSNNPTPDGSHPIHFTIGKLPEHETSAVVHLHLYTLGRRCMQRRVPSRSGCLPGQVIFKDSGSQTRPVGQVGQGRDGSQDRQVDG